MIKLQLPKKLSLVESMEFSCKLRDIEKSDHYELDFCQVGIVEPFALLIVSSEIQRLKSKNPDAIFNFENYGKMGYAGHMGFFKSFGLDQGKRPGEARGTDTHIPMKILNCEELQRDAAEKGSYVGDIIEEESEQLASMLCKQDQGAVHETLAYSIREIMRNVVEHSEATQIGLCAQYWPSRHQVEVAILDRGVGLKSTMKRNPHLDVSNHKAAINYALMPAVSGTAFKGSKRKQKGPWANSGFGLYMTSRICRNGGTFFVASGDTGMLLTTKGGKKYFPCAFSGTAIRMVIKTNLVEALNESLNLYRNDGYEIQRTYEEIVDIDPSSASLMLSKDFDLSVLQKILAKLKGS